MLAGKKLDEDCVIIFNHKGAICDIINTYLGVEKHGLRGDTPQVSNGFLWVLRIYA